jgi:hypothetical protein
LKVRRVYKDQKDRQVSLKFEILSSPRSFLGLLGPIGPQGLEGPPGKNKISIITFSSFLLLIGRDGFTERPPAFYAELQSLSITNNFDSILRPWTLSDSFNVPDVSNYFSQDTGIFTVPKTGLYQFFLTISISRSKVLENNNFILLKLFFFFFKGNFSYYKKW